MLAFAACSLCLLSRHWPSPGIAIPGPGSDQEADRTLPSEILTATRDTEQNCLVFSVPFRGKAKGAINTFFFQLDPSAASHACSIQVVAECDHHGSFSHLYQPQFIPGSGFAFRVPLEQGESYWQPRDHSGQWSSWERHGLRRLEIKVFNVPPTTTLRLSSTYSTSPTNAPATLRWSQPLADPVQLGQRFELAFDVAGLAANPFDSRATGLQLLVTDPDGKATSIAPFLFQNFETVMNAHGETILPKGSKHFRVRYRPIAPGSHAYRLLWQPGSNGPGVTLASGQFTVAPGSAPDYIRISPRNRRYFEHADGRFFYPIGWNIAYPCDAPYGIAYLPYLPREQSLTAMKKMLDDLADSGGNCIRLWQSTWWNALEWNRNVDNYGGLGLYNLKNAWITDQVLEHCDQRGIRALFTMFNHTRFNERENPYFRRNGGFLLRAPDFWVNDGVIEPTRKQLAYAIARFADSPACLSWDCVSEVDNVTARYFWNRVQDRTLAFLQFVKDFDPYRHIVANHICIMNYDYSFYDRDLIEFIQSNAYSGLAGLSEDQIFAIRDYSERFAGKNKPVMVSECGGHWAGDPAWKMKRDTIGAIWAGVASRLSGLPQSWWWNFNYGENMGLWYHVVAEFMKGEDLIAMDTPETGGWQNRPVACQSREANLRAFMVGNATRRFLFLLNYDTMCRTRLIPSVCASNTVAFSDMAPGTYVAEYWDLQSGKTSIRQRVVVDADKRGVLSPPDFTEGWMVKIVSDVTGGADARSASAVSAGSMEGPRAPTPALTVGDTPQLTWQIAPLLPVVARTAAERSFFQARIALPSAWRDRAPDVRDAEGNPVTCQWQALDGGAGWLIRIPGRAKGPFNVSATTNPCPSAWPFDPESVGLQIESCPWAGGALETTEQFETAFSRSAARRQGRVATVDQLENPLGDNDRFLSVYRGPLAAPMDGTYTLGLNSDDGGFLKIDGQTVVNWPGPHDMETLNRPMDNTWSHTAQIFLKRGLHWLECYHQEETGAQLARVGWRMYSDAPRPDDPATNLLSLVDAIGPDWQVVPPQVLDGRIPCTVRILDGGRSVCEIAECPGLRLRRPSVPVPALLLSDAPSAKPRRLYFDRAGLHALTVNQRQIPICVQNEYWTPFSVEWEQGQTGTRNQVLRTMVFEDCPAISLRIGSRDLGSSPHVPGTWHAWQLEPSDIGQTFVLSVAGVDCVTGTVKEWPAVGSPISFRGRQIDPARLLQPAAIRPPSPLKGRQIAAWCPTKTVPETITPKGLPFDVWSGTAGELRALLKAEAATGAGVILELDRLPLVQGLDGGDVYARLNAHIRAIGEAGAVPVLLLGPSIDVKNPYTRQQALAATRISDEFQCPLIDMRGAP